LLFCDDLNAFYSVGTADPVGDFKILVSRGEQDKGMPLHFHRQSCPVNILYILAAFNEIGKVLLDLVKSSFGDQYYPKAQNCLSVFRSTCLGSTSSAAIFNSWMRETFKPCLLGQEGSQNGYLDFWDRVVEAKVSLISSSEVEGCSVSQSEADEVNV
jgi:hypothetical protein